MRKSLGLVLLLMLGTAPASHAQMAHRLKGWIRTTAAAPIGGAKVRADNLSGFRGEQFVGQKEHEVASSEKGEWNITGIEAGLWLFSTSSPDTVPAVMILPVKFSQRQQVSAVGNSLTWQVPMYAYPASEHPMASLLGRDWETAGKQIWDARDVAPRDQRQALAAAIDDLRAIARVQ